MKIKSKAFTLAAISAAIGSFNVSAASTDDLQTIISEHLGSSPGQCSIRSDKPIYRDAWADRLRGALFSRTSSLGDSIVPPSLVFNEDNDFDLDFEAGAQVVYLDFEIGEPTFTVDGAFGGAFDGILFNDHVYTQEEKDEVQRRMEADFAGFNFEFTQVLPTEGPFVTLQFNSNDSPGDTAGILPTGGILFGRADEIDFGNDNFDTAAIIDANLWEFLVQLDPTGGLLTANSGIVIDENTSVEEALSIAIVNQSANTGAHELGHTLGLRHYEAFGAPGDGLPSTGTPAPDAFFPPFIGPQDASETVLHLMASGASSGIGLADSANADRFFGERSLLKLGINNNNAEGELQDDNLLQEGDLGDDRKIDPDDLEDQAPNTLVTGVNAGFDLKVETSIVEGRISELGEVDTYRIDADRGDVLNLEVISTADIITDTIFPRVRIFFEEDNGDLTFVGENDDDFESFDSFLHDVILPLEGDYVIQVDAPETIQFDITGDGINETVPLIAFGEATELDLRIGDYSLHVYKIVNDDLDDDDDDDDD